MVERSIFLMTIQWPELSPYGVEVLSFFFPWIVLLVSAMCLLLALVLISESPSPGSFPRLHLRARSSAPNTAIRIVLPEQQACLFLCSGNRADVPLTEGLSGASRAISVVVLPVGSTASPHCSLHLHIDQGGVSLAGISRDASLFLPNDVQKGGASCHITMC